VCIKARVSDVGSEGSWGSGKVLAGVYSHFGSPVRARKNTWNCAAVRVPECNLRAGRCRQPMTRRRISRRGLKRIYICLSSSDSCSRCNAPALPTQAITPTLSPPTPHRSRSLPPGTVLTLGVCAQLRSPVLVPCANFWNARAGR